MSRFDDLARAKGSGSPCDGLVPVSAARISAIMRDWSGVPVEFIAFLAEVGAGSLEDRYQIYDGLVAADELYAMDGGERLAMFGDDLQGNGDGFDTRDWRVVEVDVTNGSARTVAMSFEAFIRVKIARGT